MRHDIVEAVNDGLVVRRALKGIESSSSLAQQRREVDRVEAHDGLWKSLLKQVVDIGVPSDNVQDGLNLRRGLIVGNSSVCLSIDHSGDDASDNLINNGVLSRDHGSQQEG